MEESAHKGANESTKQAMEDGDEGMKQKEQQRTDEWTELNVKMKRNDMK